MVAAGRTPSAEFVRYAFGRPTERRIYFYFPVAKGENVRFGDSRDPVVGYRQAVQDDTPDYDGCEIWLSGFPMTASIARMLRNGQPMIDRLVLIRQPSPLGEFRISLDWSSEPNAA